MMSTSDRPPLAHAARDNLLARSATTPLRNQGSFNLTNDLRISVTQAKTLSRGPTPSEICGPAAVESQMIPLSAALSGYIPIPRCYDKVSQAGEKR